MRTENPQPQPARGSAARRLAAASATLALALSGVLLTAIPAAAAEYAVLNTNDSGPDSLRQAITDANGNPGADDIVFDPAVSGTITLLSDLPMITDAVTIVGSGSDLLTIDAAGFNVFWTNLGPTVNIDGFTIVEAGYDDAVYAIHLIGGDASISDVVATDSYGGLWVSSGTAVVTDSGFLDNDRSGIYLDLGSGESSITGVEANENVEFGILVELHNDATLTVTNTTATGNENSGIELWAEDASSVAFTATEMNGNGVINGWEGLFAQFFDDAQGTFTDTTANGNGSDGIGIDLDNRSIATFTNTTANENASDGFEGNAFKHALLTLVNTTTIGNEADGIDVSASTGAEAIVQTATTSSNDDNGLELGARGDGGPGNDASLVTVSGADSHNNYRGAEIDASHAGIVQVIGSTLTDNEERGILIDSDSDDGTDSQVHVVDSTISDNGNGSANGAGIAIVRTSSLSVLLLGSTVSTNLGNEGGGVYGRLAGENPTEVTIANSTISGNTAEIGGGMYLRSNAGASITVHSSTFMENVTSGEVVPSDSAVYLQGVEASFRDTILAGASTSDISVSDGTAVTFHYSLIETSTLSVDSLVNDPANHNIVGTDPQLGPLGANGGPTATHLPAATSPVINAGDPAWANPFLTTDQRGEDRVSGGRVDIGAVEIPAALASTGVDSPWSVTTLGLTLALAGGTLLAARRTRTLRSAEETAR